MNSLIAYYSRKGNNYVGGKIMNLLVGNTEVAALLIQEQTGSDVFVIDTVTAYPTDYHETTAVSRKELDTQARPELRGQVDKMDDYRTIFLGYPNWWGTMPMAVCTFLEAYDFSDKIIIPFCTHEGSGMGHSERDIQQICPTASVLQGLAIRGGSVREAGNAISAWLRTLDVTA